MRSRTRTILALLALVSMLLTRALVSAAEPENAASDVKLAGVIETAPPELRLIGELEVMAANDLGTWTVAGIDFTVDENTRISDRGEPMMVEDWVEVHATVDGDEFVATTISAAEEQEDIELFGAIEAFGDAEWTISSIVFEVNAYTRIMGTPVEGLLAKASLELDEEGALLARNVKVSWDERGGWRRPVQFRGPIEALPDEGLEGVWTIDGKQVDVSAQTKVMQKKALAEVGATVHLVGWTETGVVIKAILVAVVAPPVGSELFMLTGTIENLPADGMAGEWTVKMDQDVYQFQVTAATRIAGQQYAKPGARVTIVGTENAQGTKTATLVHAKADRQ